MCLFAMDDKEMRSVPATRSDDWVRWIAELRAFDPTAEQRIRTAIDQEFSGVAAKVAAGDCRRYGSLEERINHQHGMFDVGDGISRINAENQR